MTGPDSGGGTLVQRTVLLKVYEGYIDFVFLTGKSVKSLDWSVEASDNLDYTANFYAVQGDI